MNHLQSDQNDLLKKQKAIQKQLREMQGDLSS